MTQTAADPYNYAAAFKGEAEHFGPLNYTSKALEAAAVIAGASQLYGVTICSTNVATQFIWLFDARAVPANATTGGLPLLSVATNTPTPLLWIPPRAFFAGIVLANSTSATSFTAGAADCFFDVQFA